ncbi:MAG: hypothetical protein HY657_09555 [Acidobacteria bacterium]|nr:hypothetical protein [Acidobacteriota bacterium]
MAVRVEPRGEAWSAAAPVKVLEGRYFTGDAAGNNGVTYDVSPDGRRFLMIEEASGSDAPSQNIVVVQNWFEELKRLVPVD